MRNLWIHATSHGTPMRSLRVAVIVGTVLVAINQGDALLAGAAIVWWKAALTYCVPYAVSTWGAIEAKIALNID